MSGIDIPLQSRPWAIRSTLRPYDKVIPGLEAADALRARCQSSCGVFSQITARDAPYFCLSAVAAIVAAFAGWLRYHRSRRERPSPTSSINTKIHVSGSCNICSGEGAFNAIVMACTEEGQVVEASG